MKPLGELATISKFAPVAHYHWLWSSWINPQYLDASSLCELRDQLHQDTHRPIQMASFLLPEVANALAALLKAIPIYKRIHALMRLGDVKEVDESAWDRCSVSEHFYRHDIARPLLSLEDENLLTPDLRSLFHQFIRFSIKGPLFRTWLAMLVESPLNDKVSLEISRYRKGDFLCPHGDLVEDRLLSVNFYLDPDWSPAKGGQLGFRNANLSEFAFSPVFNSVSLIPIARGCEHWVSEWNGAEVGRYTISLGYHSAVPRESDVL